MPGGLLGTLGEVSAAFGVYSDLFLMIAGISIAFAVLFRGCGERRKL